MPSLSSQTRRPALKHLLQLALLLLAGFTMLGASDPATRFDHVGHQLICTCGCGEILLDCNHVGCWASGPMVNELHTQLATALPNQGVLDWFANKYGPTVLAAPRQSGFGLVAWIMPPAVLLLGIFAVVVLIRLWHRRRTPALQGASLPATTLPDHVRDRIRRDTTFEP